jgi:hypothetical protein
MPMPLKGYIFSRALAELASPTALLAPEFSRWKSEFML